MSAATDLHGLRTAWLAAQVARCLRLDDAVVLSVSEAAHFHDIGKHHIDQAVLNKPGRLDAAERRHVEMHVLFGAWALNSSACRQRRAAAEVALLHHEWWNGRGYPFGLSRETIPVAARITAVADVFDALSEERCYKPAWSRGKVMDYIAEQRGRQFDPRCADAMHEVAVGLPADWRVQAVALAHSSAAVKPAALSTAPTELLAGRPVQCTA